METDPPRKRRPRYRGTHPRRFEERYKERDPDRYAGTVAQVVASGRTPAGSHRPILVTEILGVLAPAPGELAVDATLGYGGHAEAILPLLLPGGAMLAFDVDPIERPRAEARLRKLGYGPESLTMSATSFAGIGKTVGSWSPDGVDLVLADLGVSSMQLDDPGRGFSWKREGPLDLRLNPNRGASAADLLARTSESRLVRLLREGSDEPHAERIAREIVRTRGEGPIGTTLALREAIRRALEGLSARDLAEEGDRPMARVFQALRMEVNDEMPALDAFLAALPSVLRPGGRVAILSFHSGEDRRVKKAFEAGLREGLFESVSSGPIRPSPDELRSNPRSAAAKLRWAKRAG
jgi:16S rRNA (cytosine1402-N4)-methyltransferase